MNGDISPTTYKMGPCQLQIGLQYSLFKYGYNLHLLMLMFSAVYKGPVSPHL